MKKTVELLQGKTFEMVENDEVFGKQLCTALWGDFNVFGSHRKIADEIWNALSDEEASVLIPAVCIMGMILSAEWEAEGYSMWDARKEAAASFAYKNRKNFYEIYRELMGDFPDTPGKGGQFILRVNENSLPSYLREFMYHWNSEHSTLKQAEFGHLAMYLMKEFPEIQGIGTLKWEYPLEYDDFVFPFI